MSQRIKIFFICTLFLISCTQQMQNKTKYIRLKGSDTMYIMALRWAEEYMKQNPDISIYVEGGGSAQGLRDTDHACLFYPGAFRSTFELG